MRSKSRLLTEGLPTVIVRHMKTLTLIILLFVTNGCVDDVVDSEVAQCRQSAHDKCAEIGYPTNKHCYIVHAQDCSEYDDTVAAAQCGEPFDGCVDGRPVWR